MKFFKARCWRQLVLSAVVLWAVALVLVGCDSVTHQGSSDSLAVAPSSLGEPVTGEVPTVCAGCVTKEKLGETVAIEGEIVQQCPSTGCWFRLKDEVGEVFVDLNPAKLHLQEKRVGQHAKVTGRVAIQGGQFRVEAQHVEFSPNKSDTRSSEK